MARPELGTKRVCPECGTKFFDLGKNPLECPKCDHTYEPEEMALQRAAEEAAAKTAAAKAAKEVTPKAEPEEDGNKDNANSTDRSISLEEADKEQVNAGSTRAAALDEDEDVELAVEIEDDDQEDDKAGIIKDEDDFDDDVSAIIDADTKLKE